MISIWLPWINFQNGSFIIHCNIQISFVVNRHPKWKDWRYFSIISKIVYNTAIVRRTIDKKIDVNIFSYYTELLTNWICVRAPIIFSDIVFTRINVIEFICVSIPRQSRWGDYIAFKLSNACFFCISIKWCVNRSSICTNIINVCTSIQMFIRWCFADVHKAFEIFWCSFHSKHFPNYGCDGIDSIPFYYVYWTMHHWAYDKLI